MKTNKLLIGSIIFWLTLQSATAAYNTVECNSDPVFAQNTCKQCFDGWERWQGEAIGFINDIFINKTTNPKLIYKEEQTWPSMINLGWDKVTWSQTPSSENFWEYTKDFEATFSSGQEAYVIDPSKQVNRIESKIWYAYKLDKNTVAKWQNVGLLLFSVMTHDIVNNEVSIDQIEHRECVLFKSGVPVTPAQLVVESAPVKKLPQTWPEHILLVLIALLLGLGLFGLKRKNS